MPQPMTPEQFKNMDFDQIMKFIRETRQTGTPPINFTDPASGRQSNPEMEMNRLLAQLQKEREGLMSNIRGISMEPNAEDIALMQKLQQAALAPGLAQISGAAGARGITGSSIEGVERGRFMQNLALQGEQMLMERGQQRGQFELSRNQLLFNSLVGTQQPFFNQAERGMDAMERRRQEAMARNQQGNWLQRLGRAGVGAGLGYATGGPMGALQGGAAGLGIQLPQMGSPTPSYYNYNQADFSSPNPLEWYGPSSVLP